MKKNLWNKKWYSIIISLLLIWFLLVLTIWIFRLVLNEMKSTRARWDYLKAFVWAESSQELALLWIKKNWYWYVWEIENDINSKSILLSQYPNYIWEFHPPRDVKIFFSNDWKVDSYDWKIKPLGYTIIPLFYIDDDWEHKITDFWFTLTSGSQDDLSWNIVWDLSWISWKCTDFYWVEKKLIWNEFSYSQKNADDFLLTSSTNYLILNNNSSNQVLEYNINSTNPNQYFTKPNLNIVSSWEVGDYRQNLNTNIDNDEFLNILRYSIYSK
jgi:hypothetical protein